VSNKVTIYYYTTSEGEIPVKEFINSLSLKQQAKVLRIFQYMEVYGIQSILPYIKKLINLPIWEIRILGKDNIRIFYFVPVKDTVLILHGFMKKSQKTPEKEINIGLNRYNDWQNRS
jgi:phage-related protein